MMTVTDGRNIGAGTTEAQSWSKLVEKPGRIYKEGPADSRPSPMESFLVYYLPVLRGSKHFAVPHFILVSSKGFTGHYHRADIFLPLLLPVGPPPLVHLVLSWDTEEDPYAWTLLETGAGSSQWRRPRTVRNEAYQEIRLNVAKETARGANIFHQLPMALWPEGEPAPRLAD